jgi:hypothetical protein
MLHAGRQVLRAAGRRRPAAAAAVRGRAAPAAPRSAPGGSISVRSLEEADTRVIWGTTPPACWLVLNDPPTPVLPRPPACPGLQWPPRAPRSPIRRNAYGKWQPPIALVLPAAGLRSPPLRGRPGATIPRAVLGWPAFAVGVESRQRRGRPAGPCAVAWGPPPAGCIAWRRHAGPWGWQAPAGLAGALPG